MNQVLQAAAGAAGSGQSEGEAVAVAAPTLAELFDAVSAMRRSVAEDAAETMALWQPALGDCAYLPSARNLADYLALRRNDLSELQPALSLYGLSSLGRSEAKVMTALDALLATLGRLSGQAAPDYPPLLLPGEGESMLAAATERLFGAAGDGPRTRIMVTLPSEAATSPLLATDLVRAGMNCARINCAHDDRQTWATMIAHVRAAAAEQGRDCRILMDLGGPKCRIEAVHGPDKLRLYRGDRLLLVRELDGAGPFDGAMATISFPDLLDQLTLGAEVWINDGKIGGRVVALAPGRITLEVFSARSKGERLKPEKGVNFPSTELDLPPLTDKDLLDLDFVALEADLIGFSFVQRVEDVRLLVRELAARRGDQPAQTLVLKIETPTAVRNLPQLIVAAAAEHPVAVMVARGDLAVELGFARLSEIQEEILWLCEAAHVPVIWATQVLDGLIKDGSPTRAETTDAAMSQRAECVMLNKGPYLVEAIRFLRDVLTRMDRHQTKKSARFGALRSWTDLVIPD